MKLMHLGDLHLGKSLCDFDLTKDQEYILDQILKLITKKSVDAVLIAGDVYDKSVPSEAATRLLDNLLNALSQLNVKTYIISGNHDSDERLNYGGRLFERNQIFISAVFNGSLDRHTLVDGDTVVNIYSLPFVKASHVRHFYPDAEIATYEDAVREILLHTELDESQCNILLAHQFVTGRGEDPAPGGSEGAGTLNVGTVEKISASLFDPFDYVALGHIHSPQSVGRDTIRYAGSPLKYSLSEVNNGKSVPIITIEGKKTEVELVLLRPLKDLRHLKGKMKELLQTLDANSAQDFIYATLTDEEMIPDAMGIFQQTYPNTLKIDYDNSHTREIEQVDISKIAQNKSFSELIQDFYRMIYGCEISEEEMDMMRMAAQEAGVINEAG